MHSWIFRNRDRLRLVYGSQRPQSPDGALAAQECPKVHPDQPQAGSVEHSDGDVVLMPMPRLCA